MMICVLTEYKDIKCFLTTKKQKTREESIITYLSSDQVDIVVRAVLHETSPIITNMKISVCLCVYVCGK